MRLSRLSSIALALASLATFACSSAPADDTSSSGAAVSAASTAACKDYDPPTAQSTCNSCSGSTCQANGCFGGYYCHYTEGTCAKLPSACGSSPKPPAPDAGTTKPTPPAVAGPEIVSQFVTPSSPASAGLQPVIDAINSAQSSIEMEMYHLTVTAVADALVAAAGRGVTVQVIIDQANWNSHTTAALKTELANGGVTVTPSSAKFRITHVKSFVVDRSTAYIMSLNLTSPFNVTRDYAVATTDSGVIQEFEDVFQADLTNAQNDTATTPTLSSPYLVVSPVNSESRLVALVNSATQTVIATSENLDSGPITTALEAAAKRGVDVRVITPLCDENSNTAYNIPALTALNAAGAQARAMPTPNTATTPYMHGKMIVADGAQAYLGSVNLSTASLTDARELGILVSDATTLQMLGSTFEGDWAQSDASFPATPSCPAVSQ